MIRGTFENLTCSAKMNCYNTKQDDKPLL